jgi:CheY-like chemotaxis protein
VSVREEAGSAVLRVADEGSGIRGDLLPEVFEPFTQGDPPPDRTRGLGIGLTLVRRLTELHGGTVDARSGGVGEGSEFIVRLPRCERTAPRRAAETSHESPAARRYRLLLVEDNRDSREALRMLLEAAGHEVHEAADGEAGITAALGLELDLAVVDIQLPRTNGYEVARRLRAANRDLALIALTGYGRDQDKQRAYDVGFDAHVLKPVTIERLHVVIKEVLGRDRRAMARSA